jgi:hypothetical protein
MYVIVSLKVWNDENACSGRIELYKRKSFTCTNLIGIFKFRDKQEKDALLEMLLKYHPEVDVIPNEQVTGDFADNYFKC